MTWIWVLLLALGGAVCVLNFYLSFVRYLVHRMRGRGREEYRWVSGIPMIGSALVAVALVGLWSDPRVLAAGGFLILLDTGGPVWFVLGQAGRSK